MKHVPKVISIDRVSFTPSEWPYLFDVFGMIYAHLFHIISTPTHNYIVSLPIPIVYKNNIRSFHGIN